MKKAQVGVASMGYDGNTCNMHLNDLAKLVKQGIWDEDLVGLDIQYHRRKRWHEHGY